MFDLPREIIKIYQGPPF